MFRAFLLLFILAAVQAQRGPGGRPQGGGGRRTLIRPNGEACANRVKYSEFRNGHFYFFSWRHGPTSSHERDWLDARNICRKHCQDLVSLETQQEADFIHQAIAQDNVKYIWTSGRKCNFDGCDRADLQPPIINGFFWSGSNHRFAPTNERTRGGQYRGYWSETGGAGKPQPDNREQAENGNDEACVAVLNNFYGDGVSWHDIACNHLKPWVCEDSDELLAFARQENRHLNIP